MEPKIRQLFTCLCVGLIFVACFFVSEVFSSAEKYVRVAILREAKDFKLTVRGKFDLEDILTERVYSLQRPLHRVRVATTPQGVKIGKTEYTGDRFRIIPCRDATVYVNKRRLRGHIDIVKKGPGRLTVVNKVALEDYVKGVLYHEVSKRWTLEALKAQAVVVRTYALYRISLNKNQDCDLTDDIFSQVYGGKNSERYRMSIAVERTKGLILTYEGKILPAYYHATCGGRTENAKELWKEDLPPLQGVVCPFCVKSPHYRWKKNLRLKTIQDKLNAHGYKLWLIKEIKILERNPSGRIRTLKIITRKDEEVIISGKDFRNIIGPNIIKSNNYEIVMRGYYVDLLGKGWGHGVGMCQWGANFMSRKKFNYKDILKFYYPGAKILNRDDIQGL